MPKGIFICFVSWRIQSLEQCLTENRHSINE
jgi:hypothetical protein